MMPRPCPVPVGIPLQFTRELDPTEIDHYVGLYRRYVATWNAREQDRARPLPPANLDGVEAGSVIGKGCRKIWLRFPDGVHALLDVKGWRPWQSGSFLRCELPASAVQRGALYASARAA